MIVDGCDYTWRPESIEKTTRAVAQSQVKFPGNGIDAARKYADTLFVIRSFADAETERIWKEQRSKRLPGDIQQRALNKLAMLSQASDLNDLRIPPASRLEALAGNRKGQFSIRINQQWRICFRWAGGDAHDVEITDYH